MTLHDCDADGPIHAARVRVDRVLNCPSGEKYGLPDGGRAVDAENIHQKAQKRIGGELSAPKRNVIVACIEQSRLDSALKHAQSVVAAMLKPEEGVDVYLLPDSSVMELLNERLRQRKSEINRMGNGCRHGMASIGHYLKPRRLTLITREGEQLVTSEEVDFLSFVVANIDPADARREHTVSAHNNAVTAIEPYGDRHS